MGAFVGQLTVNEIYSALYNMIISQQVFDRVGDSDELVDKAKTDGSLYGDTKLYYAADVLSSSAWGNDTEAANLLSLDRPSAPACQAIKLDNFRQIRLTLDDYLSKRAWSDENAFGQFNSIMEGMIGKTKRIYDVTLYNAFIGTAKGYDVSSSEQKVEVQVAANEPAENRAKKVAKAIADLLVEMKTVSRKFNKYGHITKFSEDDIKVIWNSAYINEIRKLDLPTIFHKDFIDKFAENTLPSIYFGTTNAADVSAVENDGSTIYRSKIEKVYTLADTSTVHVFPGELVPTAVKINAGEAYVPDDTVIAKVYVKLPPYMSAFEVGTTFFNPRSLTTNRYLTFGHNSLEILEAYPCVTVYEKATEDIYGAPVEIVNTSSNPVPTEEVSE